MFCPNCRSEYIEGVKACKECDVPLVEELPPEPQLEYSEQVTVFSSTSTSLVAMARSILESAEIECYIKDANLSNILDINLIELQVSKENEEDARGLLEDLKASAESEEAEESEEESEEGDDDADADEEEYDEDAEEEEEEEDLAEVESEVEAAAEPEAGAGEEPKS